ncbi:hypothetical protein M3Y98_00014000 [Aphelenchoides besseyi]|nr:hypothetical protein M3Y98_00014000 [Aphelenchoides besseyi]
MNPLLWIVFFLFTVLILNFRRLLSWIREQKRVIDLMNKIPGPGQCALKLSPDSLISTYQMEYFFRTYTEEKENNPGLLVLWLGPKPIVIIYQAETIKAILETTTHTNKPAEYEFLGEWLGEGLLTSKNRKWFTRRKMITPTFHFSILGHFIDVFNRQGQILIQSLEKEADSGYPFDIYPYLKALALDVICEAAMGINMNSQLNENRSYVESVTIVSALIWLRIRSPWLWPKLFWFLSGYGVQFEKERRVVTSFTKQVIADRKLLHKQEREQDILNGNETKERQRPAFLDLLLDMQITNGLSDEDIREEVETFMFEGHDTVSNTMAFFLIMVGHRLEIQDKIYEELCDIFADDMERDATTEDLSKMIYLNQCLNETMRFVLRHYKKNIRYRMFPVVPIIGRNIEEETTINGYVIPKGVTAMVAPFATQRDRRFYHDPDTFDPTHFDPDNIRKRDPFAFIPFSAGPRNCIGQRFALNELKIVLSKLLRKYRIYGTLHEIENRGLTELILRPSAGTPVRIERRSN